MCFLNYFLTNTFMYFSTHKQCILSGQYSTALLGLPKSIIPWRDSNPGILLLRRMRCRLRHADRARRYAGSWKYVEQRYNKVPHLFRSTIYLQIHFQLGPMLRFFLILAFNEFWIRLLFHGPRPRRENPVQCQIMGAEFES
jgi:hypothetical protein